MRELYVSAGIVAILTAGLITGSNYRRDHVLKEDAMALEKLTDPVDSMCSLWKELINNSFLRPLHLQLCFRKPIQTLQDNSLQLSKRACHECLYAFHPSCLCLDAVLHRHTYVVLLPRLKAVSLLSVQV